MQQTQKNETLRKAKKNWQNLDITNDFIFSKFMQDEKTCKEVLEILLPFEIKNIEYVQYQKTIDVFKKIKSVRLDVYVKGDDKVYNVEMQISKDADIAKRSRFYQAAIDFDILEKGSKYRELKESFVIFICTFDPFGYGFPCYNFKNMCQENPALELQDGRQIFFFNAKAYFKEDNALRKNFLAFVAGKKVDTPIIKSFAAKIEKIKNNELWENEYMNFALTFQDAIYEGEQRGMELGRREGEQKGMELGRREGEQKGMELGRREGEQRGVLKVARSLLGILDDEVIAEKTGLSLEKIQALKM